MPRHQLVYLVLLFASRTVCLVTRLWTGPPPTMSPWCTVVSGQVGDEVVTNPVTMDTTQEQTPPNAWQMISCVVLVVSNACVRANTAAMPGGDTPSPGPPRGPRSPKKCIPIYLCLDDLD
jgi:hypothetical protein